MAEKYIIPEEIKTLCGSHCAHAPIEFTSYEKHSDELCAHYVWENGRQQVFLCPKAAEKGTLFTTLDEAEKAHPGIGERLEAIAAADTDPYAEQLRTASAETIVLYIPRKMCQKREYLLDIILSEADLAAALRVFVYADDDASAIVTLNLHSRGENAKNALTGLLYCSVGRNAGLVLNEVQDLGTNSRIVTRKQSLVGDGGNLRWNLCELGASRSDSSLNVRLQGKDSNAVVYGLYFPTGEQQMNLLTRQDHVVPHTFSNLYYKGAVSDRADARWEGMVYVDPKAEKADGYQKNENLILSPDAHVFSKPGLEIITDDVKCSHGTTITNIDDNQIFYLTSRGIPEKQAERLVVQGFFDTVLNLITYAPIRSKLQKKIGDKMAEGD